MWPENFAAVELFVKLGTQWRMGPTGPIGLDYGCLPAVMRLEQIPRGEWSDLFDAIRVMEAAALDEMRKT